MDKDDAVVRMAALLRNLREGRGISQRQLAYHAGVNVSVVSRAERAGDAQLSTLEKLFLGLGYRLDWEALELAEDIGDLLDDEAENRACKSGHTRYTSRTA